MIRMPAAVIRRHASAMRAAIQRATTIGANSSATAIHVKADHSRASSTISSTVRLWCGSVTSVSFEKAATLSRNRFTDFDAALANRLNTDCFVAALSPTGVPWIGRLSSVSIRKEDCDFFNSNAIRYVARKLIPGQPFERRLHLGGTASARSSAECNAVNDETAPRRTNATPQ